MKNNPSLDLIGEVFRTLCDIGEPCALEQILVEEKFSRAVALEALSGLKQAKFVDHDVQSGLYSVNLLLLHHVRKGLEKNPLQNLSQALLHEISRQFDGSAQLMVRSGAKAIVLRQIGAPTFSKVLGSMVDMSLPLHCGGAPLALLANASDGLLEDYLSGTLEDLTENTMTRPDTIRAAVGLTRERGFSIGDEDFLRGITSIGAPIFGAGGTVTGAASLIFQGKTRPASQLLEVGKGIVEIVDRLCGDEHQKSAQLTRRLKTP